MFLQTRPGVSSSQWRLKPCSPWRFLPIARPALSKPSCTSVCDALDARDNEQLFAGWKLQQQPQPSTTKQRRWYTAQPPVLRSLAAVAYFTLSCASAPETHRTQRKTQGCDCLFIPNVERWSTTTKNVKSGTPHANRTETFNLMFMFSLGFRS